MVLPAGTPMAARWCDDVCGFHRRLRGGAMMTEGEVIRHPGRWWQLCVAPYFADRGVGDMRGPPMGAPKMPPRRRWQAVIVPRYTTETQQYTSHHDGSNSPAPPPGCDWVERPAHHPRMSPRPSVAKYGATHSCHHLRGGELPRLLSSAAPRPPHRHPEAAQRRVRPLSSAMGASPLPQSG